MLQWRERIACLLREGVGEFFLQQSLLSIEATLLPIYTGEAAHGALFNAMPIEQMATVDPRGTESQPIIPFTNPVSITDDRDITRRYIFALQDRAIPLALQRKMAGSTAVAESAEIDSDHMLFYSATDELIEVIDRFARS